MTARGDLARRCALAAVALAAVTGAGSVAAAVSRPPQDALPSSGVQQAPALPGAQPISARDRVYTADQTSNTVSVLDPSDDRVLGTIPLGAQRMGDVLGPQYLRDVDVHGLGFSRDGRYLDVVSVTTNSVTVLRTADNTVVSQTSVGRAAHEGFFTADGKQVWVADRALSQVDIVDAMHGGVVGHVDTDPGPSKVLFSPDGRYAYVNHLRAATIDVVDVAARKVTGHITGLADAFSSDMALSPDGRELWAAHKKAGKVSIVDIPAGRVRTVVDTGPNTNHPAFVTAPDAAYVYLTVGGRDETQVYQRHRDQPPTLVGTIKSSGVEPHGIWPSPDNTRVYVVNEHSDTVDVIDTGRRAVVDTVHTGQEGQALVYVADAVPSGTGTDHLTRQGLDQPVVNTAVRVTGPGHAQLTVRAVDGLDMVELEATHLVPDCRYTVYAWHSDQQIPLVSFTTDHNGGKPQALAFLPFLGVYDPDRVEARPDAR